MSGLGYYLIAVGIGALVGCVEVFQRYRAEPLQAVTSFWGLIYLVFNAAVALLAFYVVDLSDAFDGNAVALTRLKWSAAAGLGASTLLRAKLMNIQLPEGKELALGPEIVVQTFLGVIDRELDRRRAQVRFNAVRKLMKGIDFEKAKVRLPAQVFQAMQGVTEEETEVMMTRIAEVDEMADLSSQDKSYLLGYYLLDLVGERFLKKVLPKYADDYRLEPADEDEPEA